MMTTTDSTLRVAIVGAGVAGLTLAGVLHKHGIFATIFEREESASSRPQGGTLDLRVESGQLALKMADAFSEFQAVMRLEGQDTRLAFKDGEIAFEFVTTEGYAYNPEIDRRDLKNIFLKRVGDQMRWGARVTSVEKAKPRGYAVTLSNLSNGAKATYDLVVGADGCHSKIRSLVTDVKPGYTGVTFVETPMSGAASSHPAQCATVGKGSLYALSDGKGIFGQQNSDGTLRTYAVLPATEDWATNNEVPWDEPKKMREKVLSYFPDWCEEYRSLIALGDDSFRPWQIYALPVGHSWTHKQGITLIGDAAHVMSPFAGEGANVAMLDGARLGEAIVEGVRDGNLEEKIAEFEQDMFERAEKAASLSASNMKRCLGTKEELEEVVNIWKQFIRRTSV